MHRLGLGVLSVGLMLLCPASALRASDDLPWAFNAPRADGYSIDLSAVEPAPGTPLVVGSSVEFRITVNYSLSIAKHGVVVLVFQDEKNRSATPGGKQVAQEVSDPSGTVTLSETITVPAHAKELRLFVPLVPDGLSQTTGEITLRYPLKRK